MPPPAPFETLTVSRESWDERVVRVALDRPDVRNAFDDNLIAELRAVCAQLRDDASPLGSARVVVLTGEGRTFCAGADLNWMRAQKDQSRDENVADAREMAAMLRELRELPQATIARVHGAAIGGGCGLVAVCDIAIAADEARLAVSEVKVGIVPAVISPYVVDKLGPARARELMLTGERVDGQRAAALGLVNAAVPLSRLDAEVRRYAAMLLTSGPAAVATCKRLVETVVTSSDRDALVEYTANLIADVRVSDEGQEGMASFLAKRKPNWA